MSASVSWMEPRMRRCLAVLAAAVALAGCDGDSGTTPFGSSALAVAVAPEAAEGPECAGIHGAKPAALGPSLVGELANLYPVEILCPLRGGELLTWQDPDGTPREACLHVPAAASSEAPLPLLTFLGGSLFPDDPQTPYNGLEQLSTSAELTGDPARPGFILLVVEGRDKAHYYPFPDDVAWGFDHWYRNFDRDDPALNVDVATIDHFIAEVTSRGIVDERRLFLSGWSNGAAMAILYGLNTPGMAATAVFSSPDPFSDILAPCAQPPFGNNLRPIMTIHNSCDIAGICLTGSEAFREKMAESMPFVEYRPVIIDLEQQEVASCDPSCAYTGDPLELARIGALRHTIWPYLWNDDLLAFLRDRPLPD